jgi:hypothetical protein
VTFPVFDQAGNVTEIYGRRIGRHLPKETPKHLYLDGPHRGVRTWPASLERDHPVRVHHRCVILVRGSATTASYGDKDF